MTDPELREYPNVDVGQYVQTSCLVGGKFYTMGDEKWCDMPTMSFREFAAGNWQRMPDKED